MMGAQKMGLLSKREIAMKWSSAPLISVTCIETSTTQDAHLLTLPRIVSIVTLHGSPWSLSESLDTCQFVHSSFQDLEQLCSIFKPRLEYSCRCKETFSISTLSRDWRSVAGPFYCIDANTSDLGRCFRYRVGDHEAAHCKWRRISSDRYTIHAEIPCCFGYSQATGRLIWMFSQPCTV